MKKIFKHLLIAMLAVCAACACAFAITACGEDTENADYVFCITYADGTAINGQTDSTSNGKVRTQICETGTNGQCIDLASLGIYPDENGKLSLTQSKVNSLFGSDEDVTTFTFHVFYVTGCQDDCAFSVTQKGELICKLTAAS